MAVNSLYVALEKVACPVLPHRPFYYLFCEISDNLACRRDMPIRQSIDISQKHVLLDIVEPLAVSRICFCPGDGFAVVPPRQRRTVDMVISGYGSIIQCPLAIQLIHCGFDPIIFGGIHGY
jgi:hypothetical protein